MNVNVNGCVFLSPFAVEGNQNRRDAGVGAYSFVLI